MRNKLPWQLEGCIGEVAANHQPRGLELPRKQNPAGPHSGTPVKIQPAFPNFLPEGTWILDIGSRGCIPVLSHVFWPWTGYYPISVNRLLVGAGEGVAEFGFQIILIVGIENFRALNVTSKFEVIRRLLSSYSTPQTKKPPHVVPAMLAEFSLRSAFLNLPTVMTSTPPPPG